MKVIFSFATSPFRRRLSSVPRKHPLDGVTRGGWSARPRPLVTSLCEGVVNQRESRSSAFTNVIFVNPVSFYGMVVFNVSLPSLK